MTSIRVAIQELELSSSTDANARRISPSVVDRIGDQGVILEYNSGVLELETIQNLMNTIIVAGSVEFTLTRISSRIEQHAFDDYRDVIVAEFSVV